MLRVREMRRMAAEQGEPILRDKSFELLLDTVGKKQPEKILEIGTNVGLSGVAMLLTAKNATLSGIEIDEEKVAIAKNNYKEFGVADRAKIFLGDASEIIPILTGKYDFIFLDGPKGHYFQYLPDLLDALNVGGILFADNVLFRGYVDGKVKTPHRFMTTKNSMKKFLDAITNNPDLKTQIIDLEDGVSITEKIK